MSKQGFSAPPGDVPPAETIVTYNELLTHHARGLADRLISKGCSLKRIDNVRSVMRGWLKTSGLSAGSPIGPELGRDFPAALERRLALLRSEGKARQTVASHKAILIKCREAFADLAAARARAVKSEDFGSLLGLLIENSGMTANEIARKIGKDSTLLYSWRGGKSLPSKVTYPNVAKLESLLGASPGLLTSKLPRVLYGDRRAYKYCQTGHRQHMSKLGKMPYALKDFPARLQEEWERTVLFYTDASWGMERGMRRNSKWRVREQEGFCPTALRFRRAVSQMFGYLCLPPGGDFGGGKGMSRADLTLALLSDSALVFDYLRYKKARTYLNAHNGSVNTLLNFCISLLRPGTGFLWQSPQLGGRLTVPVGPQEWHAWCAKNRSSLREVLRGLMRDGEIIKTRDPFVPIRRIISDYRHPLDALLGMADAYEADRPARNAPARVKAAHFQAVFLIRFVSLVPLRAYNLSSITFRRDNSGNLYRKDDGSWWVRIELSQFKNHLGAAKDAPFDVPLHESLRPYVEEFLFTHRCHLVGASDCDYVFRPFGHCWAAAPDSRISEDKLSLRIYQVTQRYLPDCPGFSLHAFRHIAATEYVRNRPDGAIVAAAVLNDSVRTVERAYAHVMPRDRFEVWNRHVSKRIRIRRGDRGEGHPRHAAGQEVAKG